MSKKKNKFRSYYSASKKMEKRKNKKHSTQGYKEPKLKSPNKTLDKKDIKEQKKILLTPMKVDKAFIKNREKCNHQAPTMSVSDFKKMTPMAAVFTPVMNEMIEAYGEENVEICSLCYDALVKNDAIDIRDAKKAMVTLYAVANIAASRMKKSGKVEDISKMKDNLGDWVNVIDRAEEIIDRSTNTVKEQYDDVNDLNSINSGSAYIP